LKVGVVAEKLPGCRGRLSPGGRLKAALIGDYGETVATLCQIIMKILVAHLAFFATFPRS